MADYIERDQARQVLCGWCEYDTCLGDDYRGDKCDAKRRLDAVPSAVVHGEWLQVVRKSITDTEYRLTRCTACGYEMNNEVFFEPWNFRYCPNCGATMEVDDG